jgi:hypothetical protein
MNDTVVKDHAGGQVNPIALAAKKVKRTRLLLDARTELTDDELKVRRILMPVSAFISHS